MTVEPKAGVPVACFVDPAAGGGPEYVTYAKMDQLHRLQHPRTDSPFEMSFILISQVMELLFRMIHLEVDQARGQLRTDDFNAACLSLARGVRSQRVLVQCWESMNALPVDEFLAFREILATASGTQSFAYRAVELALGNKNPQMLRSEDVSRYPVLGRELYGRSLYDEVMQALSRLGLAVPKQVLDRDPQSNHQLDDGVEAMWRAVYQAPAKWPAAYLLAEQLIEVAYQHSCWRSVHLLVVERMLGNKQGTGGTDGVQWLRTINAHRFFPELWSMRTAL